MKQINIGFREDQLAYAAKNDLKLPQLIRKLLDSYIDAKEAERRKIDNITKYSNRNEVQGG